MPGQSEYKGSLLWKRTIPHTKERFTIGPIYWVSLKNYLKRFSEIWSKAGNGPSDYVLVQTDRVPDA